MRPARLAALAVLALALLATPPVAEAQLAAKGPRIGFLVGGSQGDPLPSADAFRQGLGGLGYVEGRNIAIEYRYADGRIDRFSDLASELARLPVDLIVAPGTAAALAARKATATIPIVLVLAGNPVGDGLIKSFARPGWNATGLTMSVGPEIGGKLLELLREAVPTVSRVAVLWNPLTAPHTGTLNEMETAARALGLALQPVSAQRPDEIDPGFTAMARARADGLIVLPDPMFDSVRVGLRIRDSAAKAHVPAMYGIREHPQAGGLMSYGPSVTDLYRRAAGYVDRILKGAKPADLPVERPTRFELVINLRTAKALGLTIPPSVLARADEIYQ
jgi:ABC-type uncharacterized transport system substrate-binding protein